MQLNSVAGGQWLAQIFQLKNLCENSATISPLVAQANKTTLLFCFLFKNERIRSNLMAKYM